MRRWLIALACAASFARAQEPAADPGIDAVEGGGPVTDLDTVRVTAPRFPPPDPLHPRNPIEVQDTMFDRDWRETPSLEDIGMQGGIVNLAVGYALMKTAEGVKKLPGWKHQVRPAVARPPPLDEAQMERARRAAETP